MGGSRASGPMSTSSKRQPGEIALHPRTEISPIELDEAMGPAALERFVAMFESQRTLPTVLVFAGLCGAFVLLTLIPTVQGLFRVSPLQMGVFMCFQWSAPVVAMLLARRYGLASRAHILATQCETIVTAFVGAGLIFCSRSAVSILWFIPLVTITNSGTDVLLSRTDQVTMAGAYVLLSFAFLGTGKPEDAILCLFFGAVLGFVYWNQKQAAWRSLKDTAEKELLRSRLEGVIVREERRRIARDLHDGVGADLTSLLWRARELGADVPGERAQELERISEQAHVILDGLRHVVSGLKLESVDYEAGARGIEQRCRQLVGEGVSFSFSVRGKGKLTGADLHELEHIATEAVRNAVRHSQGTWISVELVLNDEWVSVRIADDGLGVNADAVAQSSGGLSHLRDRAQLRGGDWGVVADESGTVVQVRLPQKRALP